MRLLPATLLLAASGCAQLFGIDETTGPTVDPSRVSLTMQRWSIGGSISKNPLDLSKETATFLVDDGAGSFTKLPGELTNVDTFSAALPTGTPPVLFTLPDMPTPYPRLWASPARDRRGVFSAFEHPNPQAPLPNSEIMLTVNLPSMYASNEAFRVEAIGAWMTRGLLSTELPAPDLGAMTINTMLPYASFSRATSSTAARITSQDVVVVERYVGNTLTGVYQAPPFDQTDGIDPINANLVPVPANKPLTAMVMPSSYTQRYSAVRPAVTGLGMSWIVNAAPGWTLGTNVGPRLHANTVAATDTMISTMFGNPFESLDWRSLFQFTTQSTRTFMFQGMAPLTLSAGMSTVAEPTGTLTLDLPAGLPINIRANQVPLSTDGMMVTLDLTKPVEVDAITDKPNSTVYFVTLYEVTLSTDGMSVERKIVVDTMTTGEPKLKLPPELFQTNHYYYFDFRCMQGGYTNAATGDLQTLALPFSVSRADSAVFQVAP
ncbi:MAG TPA: hypothetical protein VIV40_06900 [Kofleriaceae bacterium]